MLDGEDLETLSVTVDGEKGAFSVTPNALTIADVPDAFTLRSVVRIEGAGVNESILVVSGQERWQGWRRW